MKTEVIFVVFLSIVRGCSSGEACTSQTPVVHACRATQSGQVTGPLYLDTGTGPNFQENRCQCRMSVSQTNIGLVFQSIAGASFNHSIEVAGYVLNVTTARVEVKVVKSDPTELWIKTDGIGGVCVSVAINPPDNGERFGITCFPGQATILTSTTSSSSVSVTSSVLQTKTAGSAGSIPTSDPKLQLYVNGQDNKNLIGPVVGGVSGFVVLVTITATAIYCIRKQKHENNQNVTRSYENENVIISQSPVLQQTYECNQLPTYYNQGTSSLSDNGSLPYEGVTRHALNEHIYLGISENRTTATSKNHINNDYYAN